MISIARDACKRFNNAIVVVGHVLGVRSTAGRLLLYSSGLLRLYALVALISRMSSWYTASDTVNVIMPLDTDFGPSSWAAH